MSNQAFNPDHYDMHTADDIEAVIDGLPAKQAAQLYNILKYFDRRNKKGNKELDLKKANNSAHRLVFGDWKKDADILRPGEGEEVQRRPTRARKETYIQKQNLR